MLFIVPEPSACTPSAAYSAPVIACEVSTLPATTAAGYAGASIEPSGITRRSGRRHPSLSGMSVGDERAEHVQHRRRHDRRRGVEVGGQLRRRPREVDRRRPPLPVDRDPHGDHRAGVHLVAVGAVVERVDDPADRLLGVVLDVTHVGQDDVEAEVVDHLAELLDAPGVRGDLRPQVAEVGVRARDGYGASVSSRRVSASRNRPSATSSQLSNSTPSSSTLRLFAGIEPGVIPPTSAW